MRTNAPTLTLYDIARTAGVQRSVVSMWVNRQSVRGEIIPFPTPVSREAGVDLFDRDEIVRYLRRTQRGNNPDFALDAPAAASPAQTGQEILSLLLVLRLLSGQELTGLEHSDLASLAEEADPEDDCLLSEVRAIAELRLQDLEYVDDLVEASLGPQDAFDRLAAGRAARLEREREVSETVIGVLAELCESLAAGAEHPVVIAGSRLALRVASCAGDSLGGLRPDGTTPADRVVRREAMARSLVAAESGVSVIRIVSVHGMSDAAALTAADDLQLELAPGEVGVLLGPASLLCDAGLPKQILALRADVLRDSCLRAAVRLRHGHLSDAPRQALGVWLLQGGAQGKDVALADLSGTRVEDVDGDDLATDLLAAFADDDRRHFRYLRVIPRLRFLAQRAIVPPGVRARLLGRGGASRHLERVHELTLSMATLIPSYDVTVEPAPGSLVVRSETLEELVAARRLVMKRGARLDVSFASREGSVVTINPSSDAPPLRFDPLDVEQHFPRAVRTEPGDVVYVTDPRPRAVVDSEGGSLVTPPARILRLLTPDKSRDGEEASRVPKLGPHTLAETINRQAESAKDWHAWPVPVLSPEESDALEAELAKIAETRTALLGRVDGLQSLLETLIDGTADGALSLVPRTGSS